MGERKRTQTFLLKHEKKIARKKTKKEKVKLLSNLIQMEAEKKIRGKEEKKLLGKIM